MKYAGKVDVIYEGSLIEPYRDDIKPVINQSYLLYVGDRRPHKNIQRVIDLFVALKDKHGYSGVLVLVGSCRNYGFDVEKYVDDRHDVVITGNVSDGVLAWLYKHTDGLLFLSEYEGFGLPVIEAATFNRKIVISDGGSLPEIAPSSAFVVPCGESVVLAAPKVAAYLADSLPEDLNDYLCQFAWTSAARQLFPLAFPTTERQS
jgi:glycosyltransferase involved in cell wall biosynthesis